VTSSISSLAVPTDIPWRRICVTGDMLDPEPCDLIVPPRWRSSIAVFRHDPPDEFQPLPHSRVSYLKVCVTLAPFAPELEVKLGRRAADMLEEAFPCHGALLHVTVAPPEDARGGDRRDFPYFADFEPKKRELYEMVSETGEVLSGSSSTLSVGKSSASTQTTENYNIDNGWNFGTNFTYAGTGGGGQVGVAEDRRARSPAPRATRPATSAWRDESVERRELMSHTTQLAQMYNLFQAFHVGTNRALFLMEPRPHIRQSEATFINGPRALEGIQEVFLAVVRPREMDGFCVGVLLETAHLGKEPVLEHETTTRVVEFRLEAKAPNLDTSDRQGLGRGQEVAHRPLRRAEGLGDQPATRPRPDGRARHQGSDGGPRRPAPHRHGRGELALRGGQDQGRRARGHLSRRRARRGRGGQAAAQGGRGEGVRALAVPERAPDLLLPEGGRPRQADRDRVRHLRASRSIAASRSTAGRRAPARMHESRRLAATIRDEMVRSTTSSARVPVGARRYEETDAFAQRFAAILPPVEAPMISRSTRPAPRGAPRAAHRASGRHGEAVDALTLLHAPVATTARRMGVTEAQARQLRLRAIEALAVDGEG
jgi:hypothetical protein